MAFAHYGLSHHGLTESRFLVRAKATNGLGTFTGLVWKVLKGFGNISRGALEENGSFNFFYSKFTHNYPKSTPKHHKYSKIERWISWTYFHNL